MKLTYWINRENKIGQDGQKTDELIPMIHGHIDVKTKYKILRKKSDDYELRVCIEIGKDEEKYEWREQIMFLAKL